MYVNMISARRGMPKYSWLKEIFCGKLNVDCTCLKFSLLKKSQRKTVEKQRIIQKNVRNNDFRQYVRLFFLNLNHTTVTFMNQAPFRIVFQMQWIIIPFEVNEIICKLYAALGEQWWVLNISVGILYLTQSPYLTYPLYQNYFLIL